MQNYPTSVTVLFLSVHMRTMTRLLSYHGFETLRPAEFKMGNMVERWQTTLFNFLQRLSIFSPKRETAGHIIENSKTLEKLQQKHVHLGKRKGATCYNELNQSHHTWKYLLNLTVQLVGHVVKPTIKHPQYDSKWVVYSISKL